MSNIIKLDNGKIIIMNGGDPINDCPQNWDEALFIQDNFLNKGLIDEDGNGINYKNPLWRFDCGFKLDFDGSLIRVSSRFYPPRTHGGSKWDGTVDIILFGNHMTEKKFETNTLKELKLEVDKYIESIVNKLKTIKFD